MHLLPTIVRVALAAAALGALNAVAAMAWNSKPMLRLRGVQEQWARRWFGAPKPVPVEIGPDGRWRRYVTPKSRRSEARAGRILIGIGVFIVGGCFVLAFLGH